MNKKKNIFTKIKSVHKNEGFKGINKRLKMKAQTIKQLGLSGITDRIKGKIIELKEGKYSLKYAYPKRFFVDNLNDSRPMAEYLAPKITKALNIKSVIDLGCATGHWVNVFERQGVDIVGVEGGENAKSMLVCSPEKVIFADLREPLKLKREFDMAMSIEVAEHIEHKFVHEYIKNMTKFSPKLIMMTAAVPGQGGEFHVNEQNADYWNDILGKYEYKRVDSVERLIAKFVQEAKDEKNPPEIMKNHIYKHEGVYIPYWMPKNLLVYSKSPEQFDYLKNN